MAQQKAFKVKSLRELSPAYAEMQDRYTVLRTELSEAEAELREVNLKARAAMAAERDLDERAEKIIQGIAPETITRREQLGRRIEDLRRACQILGTRIEDERLRISDQVVKEIEPHFRELVATLCKTLALALDANRAVSEVMDALGNENIAYAQLAFGPFRGLNAQLLNHYFATARAAGYDNPTLAEAA